MNWDILKENWAQLRGEARVKWGKLTHSNWQVITGSKDKLVDSIVKDRAQKQSQMQEDLCSRTP